MTNERSHLLHLLEQQGDQQLWVRPPSGKWSAGEHLDHLLLTLNLFRRFISIYAILTGWAFRPINLSGDVRTTVDSIFDRADYKPRRAAPGSQPKQRMTSLQQLKSEFEEAQREFEAMLTSYNEAKLLAIRFPFPPYGTINIVQAVYALWRHEAHHFRRIRALTNLSS